MKKWLCLLSIVLFLLTCSASCRADLEYSVIFDELQNMSITKLYSLRNLINNEIKRRGGEFSVSVPSGTWIVGEDLPSGLYSIKYSKNSLVIIDITDENGGFVFYQLLSQNNWQIGKIELKDGYRLTVNDSVTLGSPVSLEFF